MLVAKPNNSLRTRSFVRQLLHMRILKHRITYQKLSKIFENQRTPNREARRGFILSCTDYKRRHLNKALARLC